MLRTRKGHSESLDSITNNRNSTVERLSFDAWGRRRNATDWSYSNVPSSFLFDRGFTGHEHMDAFGLINMNGRVYDPYQGRFLSPDIVVQNLASTQDYNRYSYCINNPLKYTDPSGYTRPASFTYYWNEYLGIMRQGQAARDWQELTQERQSMGYYVGRELWIMEQHSRNPIAVYDERGNRYSVYWHLGGYFGISEGKVVWQSTNNYILLRSDVPVKDGSLSIDIILENGSKLTNEIDNIYYPWVRIPLPKIVTQGGGKPSGQGVNYNDQYAGAVEKLAGKPYVLGADGPKAYDCSSTACYGIRTVANPKFGDYTAHDLYKKFSVPSSSKTRGSVIFYDYTSDGRIDHVTTILNSSNMLHPSSGAGVLQIKPINYLDSYTNNRGGTIYYREFNWLIINKTP